MPRFSFSRPDLPVNVNLAKSSTDSKRDYEAERPAEKYIELVKKGPNVEIMRAVLEKIEEKRVTS